MLGFVPVLSSVAVGGTHTINAKKAGIIKLMSISGGGQCTGTVVGVRPLTVLTAFHCISHIETGDVMIGIENEKEALKADRLAYTSTKAIVSPHLAAYPEAGALKLIGLELNKFIAEATEAKAGLAADPKNEELKAKLQEAQARAYQLTMLYQQGLQQMAMRTMVDDPSGDLAVLVFERYKGPLNSKSTEELIDSGELIPVSPNKDLVRKRVAFAGFGMTGEAQSSASTDMGAFTNVVQKQHGNLLATYGMLPGNTDGPIERGNMGAVLPGDSGGPLMNDFGIVGVASYIKRAPMETDREPAPGWPIDNDGFYSYLTGRFVDLSSPKPTELIAAAKISHKLNIEENFAENLAITDLSTWGQTRVTPAPLELKPPSVFAQSNP